MRIAADAVELAARTVSGEAVACGQCIKAVIVRAVPFLEPAACRFERIAGNLCAANTCNQFFKVSAVGQVPAFGAHGAGHVPCVEPSVLGAFSVVTFGACASLDFVIHILGHPGLRTDLHNRIRLAVARIGKRFGAGRQNNCRENGKQRKSCYQAHHSFTHLRLNIPYNGQRPRLT